MRIKKEIESVILLALIKCVSEQCYILNHQHKMQVKQKFNRLFKAAKQYEKEIDLIMESTGDFGVESVYDTMMETINDSKTKVYEQITD
jgi:hypothetical protein|tara:strand:+ start:243 stop:509 length:267 start_codon:yes stop_codon:yes gene_type:complete